MSILLNVYKIARVYWKVLASCAEVVIQSYCTTAKMRDRQKEILDDNDDVMETDQSLGSSNVVKSQVITTSSNKDIFEVGNDEGSGVGPEGRNSSRVCEVKPLPRDTDASTLVSMEIINKGKQELDNSSGEND